MCRLQAFVAHRSIVWSKILSLMEWLITCWLIVNIHQLCHACWNFIHSDWCLNILCRADKMRQVWNVMPHILSNIVVLKIFHHTYLLLHLGYPLLLYHYSWISSPYYIECLKHLSIWITCATGTNTNKFSVIAFIIWLIISS